MRIILEKLIKEKTKIINRLSHPNSRNDSANLLEGIDDEKEKIINKDDNEIKSLF